MEYRPYRLQRRTTWRCLHVKRLACDESAVASVPPPTSGRAPRGSAQGRHYNGRRPKQPTTTFSSLDYSSATHDPNTSAWSQKATQQPASTTTRCLKPSPFQSCLWFRSLLLVRHRFFFLVWRRVRATLGMPCRCCREQSGVASFYGQSLARLSQAGGTRPL